MSNVLETAHNSAQATKLFEFTQGIHLDKRLADAEVRVQKAWVRALGHCEILKRDEVEKLQSVLDEALTQMQNGTFNWRVQDEDIHMNIERFVTEKLSSLGKKMHLGRSRNDLIATTLRLYADQACHQIQEQICHFITVISDRAKKDIDVIIPGMTHMQHGQPIRYSHVLSSHAWGLSRDLSRLHQARTEALNNMPLGSAALAGTTLSVDLEVIAEDLGFKQVSYNSYDSVGDRDFFIQGLDAFASIALHLTRLCEDIIIWASTPLGLVKLPTAWSTGSSIMPNKRNPDVAELIRARSAKVIGASNSARTLMKGLPSSYNSDLHELKAIFMQSYEELANCLSVFPEFIKGLQPVPARAQELLKRGHLAATDIADYLTTIQGVPFREAYKQVAALVEAADGQGVELNQLPMADVQKLAPKLQAEFLTNLTFESCVERRQSYGGTAKARVLQGLDELKQQIADFQPGGPCNGHGLHRTNTAASGRVWEMAEWIAV